MKSPSHGNVKCTSMEGLASFPPPSTPPPLPASTSPPQPPPPSQPPPPPPPSHSPTLIHPGAMNNSGSSGVGGGSGGGGGDCGGDGGVYRNLPRINVTDFSPILTGAHNTHRSINCSSPMPTPDRLGVQVLTSYLLQDLHNTPTPTPTPASSPSETSTSARIPPGTVKDCWWFEKYDSEASPSTLGSNKSSALTPTLASTPLVSASKTRAPAKVSEDKDISGWSGGYDFVAKIIVLGDYGVGKSSLLNTLGAMKDLSWCRCRAFRANELVELEYLRDDKKILVKIMDTGGQERFRSMTSSYFRGAHGCLLTFSISNEESFDNIINWYHDLNNHASPHSVDSIPALVVGTVSSPTFLNPSHSTLTTTTTTTTTTTSTSSSSSSSSTTSSTTLSVSSASSSSSSSQRFPQLLPPTKHHRQEQLKQQKQQQRGEGPTRVPVERAFRLAESLNLTYCETHVKDEQMIVFIVRRLVNSVLMLSERRPSLVIIPRLSLKTSSSWDSGEGPEGKDGDGDGGLGEKKKKKCCHTS